MKAITAANISKKFRHSSSITLKSYLLKEMWKKRKDKTGLFWAIRDVNLAVEKGIALGIIGQNGSGKSTFLKILAGILHPDAGHIAVNGRISALIELGAGFHPEFTGRENVYINGMLLGLSKKEINKRIDEIIDFAGLSDFIDEPVRTYSSGMYSRLGFSVAVNVNPDILLMDEVFAVGDEAFVHKCKAKMNEFKRLGKTIIFVTHDLETIEKWCDEAVWLHHGALKSSGNSLAVVDAYKQEIFTNENLSLIEQNRKVRDNLYAATKGKRWGNREVEIISLKLLDSENKERYNYRTGEKIIINIQYETHKSVERPVCGIAIIRSDGVRCYGTNNDIEKIEIDKLSDTGSVIITLKNLNLLDGQYYIDAAIHAKEGVTYDYHSQLYPFNVTSEKKDKGIFRLDNEWEFSGGFLLNSKPT